jgi:predicted RecA/RadA family phage recombinase
MAKNFKYGGGGPKGDPQRVQIDSASGALTSGALSAQEGFVGVVDHDVASGALGTLLIDGVFNLPVPSGTVKGDRLYVPGTLRVATEGATVVMTKTAGTDAQLVGMAVTARDSAGNADVKLAPQPVALSA